MDVGEYGPPDGVSVGSALAQNQAYTTNHPLYKALALAMEQRLAELATDRAATRASGRATVVTMALHSDESQALSRDYPEFTLVNHRHTRTAHPVWVQARRLGGEWLLMQAEKVATTVAAAGVPWLAALTSSLEDCHMLVDFSDPVAVHEQHQGQMDVYRVFSNAATISADLGRPLSMQRYEAAMSGKSFRSFGPRAVLPEADVLCVDGGLYGYGPMQVAAMMMQTKATMAYGFFVYHAAMMLETEGEIPGTGVYFRRDASKLEITYPDGLAGVREYDMGAWSAWLTSHSFSIGSGAHAEWFQLELMKNRGPFMFYRIIAVDVPPQGGTLVHALELDTAQDMYVVQSWQLKELGLNPGNDDSWEPRTYLASRRLVDRVYQFAMQLPREQFTRYAIRKQLHNANDRVTIEGTSVKVNSPLGLRLMDALVVDIYARAFADRYALGNLTQEAMAMVKSVAGFSEASMLWRVLYVARVCAATTWDYTVGAVNEWGRNALDHIRDALVGGARPLTATFSEAPTYMLLSDCSKKWTASAPKQMSVLVRERSRQATLGARGLGATWAAAMASSMIPEVRLEDCRFRVEDVALFNVSRARGGMVEDVVGMMRELNEVDERPSQRYSLTAMSVVRAVDDERACDFMPDPDPVWTLSEFYAEAVPGVASQNLEYDTASISLDPQDRTLAAPYMRLPSYFGEVPKPRTLYHSKLRALNVPKRQGTLQELLSSVAARNLNAPQVALPQDEENMAQVVWNKFLDEACVPDARERLLAFKRDPVGLEEDAFREWVSQSTADKLAAVRRELEEKSQALGEMPVHEYLVMLKADVKPTLSTKPIYQRTEPQVIVYHEKALSAFYSSVFRVLVRRFLSIIRPNYHVNLLKDSRDITSFLQTVHPFGVRDLKYLENDFSKYDKSQGRFVFILEELVFAELGMSAELLKQWLGGHVECSLRSVSLGLSLHVMYQRKSGDATTSFGNVVLNLIAVTYAYAGTAVLWALFMGDDSLICARQVGQTEEAAQVMAEVFNLGAKTYMTKSPYFASNFVVIDDTNERIVLVPDPVKRVERWSMMVNADDPQWDERFTSAADAMAVYRNCMNVVGLEDRIAERYAVSASAARGVADAIATVVTDKAMFRSMWEDVPEVSIY